MSVQGFLGGCHFAFLLVLSAACVSPPPAVSPETSLSPAPPMPEGSLQPSELSTAPVPSSSISADASPLGTSWAPCGFPADARADVGIVKLRVRVNVNGSALDVEILSAPNQTFADHARSCALTRTYRPARSASGETIDAYTPSFFVRFVR